MENVIKIKCPAKINLTLEVVNKREDGFHNIKSIMQMISLYDFLTIKIMESDKKEIKLFGTNNEIPYDEKNLVYKAVDLYLKEANIENISVNIFIEKNIPIAAGLAGGSTDAAGTFLGLNLLLKRFDFEKINDLCAKLGSDLNVCLTGGCVLATSRGEVVQKLINIENSLTIIKPKNLGISAGEAYKKYAAKNYKPHNNMTEKMLKAISNNKSVKPYLYNDLEYAVFDDYAELKEIKQRYPQAIMSGSGPTYFLLEDCEKSFLDEKFLFINKLKFIPTGVEKVD